MSAVSNRRNTDSKYVSVFADSQPDVDCSFREEFLERPSNHYQIGVENLTMSLNNMSMFDNESGYVIRIGKIKRGHAQWHHYAHAQAGQTNLNNWQPPANNVNAALVASALNAITAQDASIRVFEDDDTYMLIANKGQIYQNVQGFMDRLNEIARKIDVEMTAGLAHGGTDFVVGYTPINGPAAGQPNPNNIPAAGSDKPEFGHLRFSMRSDGRIVVYGTRAFWANYFFSIEKAKYQYALWGQKKQYKDAKGVIKPLLIGMDYTGAYYPVGYVGHSTDYEADRLQALLDAAILAGVGVAAAQQAFDNRNTAYEANNTGAPVIPNATMISFFEQGGAGAADVVEDEVKFQYTALTAEQAFRIQRGSTQAANHNYDFDIRNQYHELILPVNIWASLDRRVSISMGCSLPVNNSPMIDHNKEHPDFTIGRWLLDPSGRVDKGESSTSVDLRNSCAAPSVMQLQGPRDRIIYHTLRPQTRVQTLRLKLFLRTRTYDEVEDSFGMTTSIIPTAKTDWWHCRLHFISKD